MQMALVIFVVLFGTLALPVLVGAVYQAIRISGKESMDKLVALRKVLLVLPLLALLVAQADA
jgi:Sec-independent protein translocase protein TatA